MIKPSAQPLEVNIIQAPLPTNSHSDEVEPCETAEENLRQAKNSEISFAIGDMNVKVGEGKCGEEVGQFGKSNEREVILREFCKHNDLCIANILFNHHPRHLCTWTVPSDDESEILHERRNQTDYF